MNRCFSCIGIEHGIRAAAILVARLRARSRIDDQHLAGLMHQRHVSVAKTNYIMG